MIWLGVVVCLVVTAYLYMVKDYGYWKKWGVPHDEPSYMLLNLKDMIMTNVNASLNFAKLYEKYKKYPYCGTLVGNRPAIVAIDLDLIKTVLIRDFSNFTNNGFYLDIKDHPILGSNPFVQIDDAWKRTRSIWTPSMTTARVKMLYDSINESSNDMVEFLRNHFRENPNDEIDTKVLYMKFFTNAISKSVFRLEIDSFKKTNSAYKMIENVFEFKPLHMLGILISLAMPFLGKLFKVSFISKTSEEEIYKLSRDVIENRRINGFQKSNPLDSVMTYDKTDVTESEIAGICFNFLIDGTETSSAVASFMLYSIAANPEVQEKLRTEIDTAYKVNNDQLTYDIIHDLPYLDMVLWESLRMAPPLISTQRVCKNHYTLPSLNPMSKPITLKKNSIVIIPIYGLHRDPEYFPEPEKFDPERFNESNKSSTPKYCLLPFGEGPRICLGMRMAINQIKIGTVALIRNFELKTAPKMTGRKIEIDTSFFLLKFKDGLWITLHERK